MVSRDTIEAAVQRILYPLVNLWISYGLTEKHLERIFRSLFVKVAAERIKRGEEGPETKPTATRISVMTGVPRKEILPILRSKGAGTSQDEWYRDRCAKVLFDWWHTLEYIDGSGTPLEIPFSGDAPSFECLVRQSGLDLSPFAVLEELKNVQAVTENDDGKLVVHTKIFSRRGISPETLSTIADTYYNLGATITDITLRNDKSVKEDTVFTLRASPAEAHVLLNRLRKATEAFLRSAQTTIDSFESSTDKEQTDTVRVGVGAYVFKGDEMSESEYFTVSMDGEEKKAANE